MWQGAVDSAAGGVACRGSHDPVAVARGALRRCGSAAAPDGQEGLGVVFGRRLVLVRRGSRLMCTDATDPSRNTDQGV